MKSTPCGCVDWLENKIDPWGEKVDGVRTK
jgi:hypothetical protein